MTTAQNRPHSPPSKFTFDELLRSATIFFYDPDVEDKFNAQIEAQAKQIREANIGHGKPKAEDVLDFILNQGDALRRILGILHLPREKFLRIVSLVRELDMSVDQVFHERVNEREWSLDKIETKMRENSGDNPFAKRIVDVLLNGYKDVKLEASLPQIYRERLQLETLNEYTTEQDLTFNLKDQYGASYNAMKGFAIESRMKEQVKLAKQAFAQGACALVDRKVDLMVPSAIDPRIIIMSSYDETTSSGQSTRATDMIALYESLQHRRMQGGQETHFVNVVDGGGWLARRKDLKRMWKACDFCLNINTLSQLQQIIEAIV
jgi:hypothetical protein